MERPGKIAIFYTDAGGGHRATAQALQAALEQNTPYRTTLCNPYRELIADIDLFPRFTRYSNEDIYNRFVLGKGWTNLFCLVYYGLTLINVKRGTKRSTQRFLSYWQKNTPDLVVSVMPLANYGIYQSVRAYTGKRPVPFLIVITDLEEKQKHIWFPPGKDYHIVCGSTRAYRQALNKPHPQALTHLASSLPVHPSFYQSKLQDLAAERMNLGLQPNQLTGCMMYGTAGSPRMVQLARALQKADSRCQMIFLCGRNQSIAEELARLNLSYPHLIRTYTRRVPYYFQLADFLVCKPGPGTISEARVSGLALLADLYNVLPQERYNIQWIRENSAGLSFRRVNDFCRAVQDMSASGGEPAHRPVRSAITENRGIFEMIEIIRSILEGS